MADVALADDDGDHAALDVVPVNYRLRVPATKYNMSNCARGSSSTANHSLHPNPNLRPCFYAQETWYSAGHSLQRITAPPFWLHIVQFYTDKSACRHCTATYGIDARLPTDIAEWC